MKKKGFSLMNKIKRCISYDINSPNLTVIDKNNVLISRYRPVRESYWERSGWLPSAEERRKYFVDLEESNKLKKNIRDVDPVISEFYDYIEFNSNMRQGVEQMIQLQWMALPPPTSLHYPIKDIPDMCYKLNYIIGLTPQYSNDSSNPLIGVPMAALFADVAQNPPGMGIFLSDEFNQQLKKILNVWYNYLSSQDSFTTTNNGNWLSDDAKQQYNFDDYQTQQNTSPYWNSWNCFFTRQYKEGKIPVVEPNNNNVIVQTNDGVQERYRFGIGLKEKFWLKDMPYSLQDIFSGEFRNYGLRFINGNIFQSYLDPFNYHRYHTPVSGRVVARGVLPGAYFPQLVWEYEIPDPGAGTLSLPWLLECNARGILIIDTTGYANIGYVCVIPIGMGEVSTVEWFINTEVGKILSKGDQIGCFKFGGSSIAIIFEDTNKYGKTFFYNPIFQEDPPSARNIYCNVNQWLATISES